MRQLELPSSPARPHRANGLATYGLRGRIRLARLAWAGLKLKTRLWAHKRPWIVGGAEPEALRRIEGAQIRDELVALGPTFIKIGQMLSTRVDLLPLEYTEELRTLLDSVPPYPTPVAFSIIEEELGKPVSELFQTIDTFPIASASLGQVYRARLTNGADVVVKVQRPNLESAIDLDIATLRHIAPRLESSGLVKSLNWNDIIDEFATVIGEEIDYARELRNAERFRANFAKWPSIHVPRMYPNFSSQRVITMEYIPGVKVDDHVGLKRLGLTPDAIAERLVETYLKQLLEDGFFHADPHPGNLRVMSDGRIAFFDFGMVGEISRDLQSKLVDAFFHIVERDWFALLTDAITLGFLKVDPADETALRDIGERLIAQYEGMRIGDLAFREMTDEVAEVLYRYPFQIPAHFTFILRALTTLEGIGSKADPNFNFFQVARPYAKDFMLRREGRHIGGQLLARVLRGEEGKVDWTKTWKLAKLAFRHYLNRR